jgi:hypothetical protein
MNLLASPPFLIVAVFHYAFFPFTIFIYSLPLAWKRFVGVLGGKNSLFLNFLVISLKEVNHV